MAYKMYFGDVLMPITPSKIKLKVTSQNKTITLINGEEINILKSPGLSDVSFDLVLPQQAYPFSNGTPEKPQYYLALFEKYKTEKTAFQWIVNRTRPNGDSLFHTNLTVGLEDYQITDDVKEGLDITVSIKLKQWKKYGTKTVKLDTKKKTATKKKERETSNAPKETSYKVKSGDCLWNIAKQYLGDGSRWKEIYNLNKDKIKNPNLIYAGQTLVLPS